jgi:uncharacterized protein involved in exopolysaccharide biosynthesis
MEESKGGFVEERRRSVRPDDVIDLGGYFAVFRKVWWKVALLSLAAGLVALLVTLRLPDVYQATAVITPPIDEKKQVPALGALATIGIDIGSSSKVEELETLFRSSDLTVRIFRKYNLWPIVLGDRYDPASGRMTPTWLEALSTGERGPRPPGYWDAVRAARKRLIVTVNKKSGTLSISFDSPSPAGSADIVKHYLEEGKSRLQEEALERAGRNKKFIEEQLGKTSDLLSRDRLYTLFGQEMERDMLARNREQFGFKVIDFPEPPDRKTRPQRLLIALLTTVLSFLSVSIIVCIGSRERAVAVRRSEKT